MSAIVFLDASFDEVLESSGVYRLELGEELHFYSLARGVWTHASPYTFGEAFPRSTLSGADLPKLQRYIEPEETEGFEPFPETAHVATIHSYAADELAQEIPESNAITLVRFYRALFPVAWRWTTGAHTCVIYDGFYGRFVSESYEPYYSAASYRSFVTSIFGVARKDTLRETRSLTYGHLALAYVFKGLLPVETILEVLQAQSDAPREFEARPEGYRVLDRVSTAIRRRLMEDTFTRDENFDSILMNDALAMLSDVPQASLKKLKGVSSWAELHERTMNLVELNSENGIAIRLPKALQAVGLQNYANGMNFIPLTASREFISVGESLDICLGKSNYFNKARRGISYCLVGLHGGEPQFAVELQERNGAWKVIQFRGTSNTVVPQAQEYIRAIETHANQTSKKEAA